MSTTTSTVAQATHTCPMLAVILATIFTLVAATIIFPHTRATFKSTIRVANRAFALAVGRCFVAMLWPLIWLINRLSSVKEEDDDGMCPVTTPGGTNVTVAATVQPPTPRRPLADLRQWRKDSYKKLKREGYQSVFCTHPDDEE